MVTSIVRQSIIIKCNQQASTLLGNYEFYYAAGLAKKLFGFQIDETMPPVQLAETIQSSIKSVEPQDEKAEYLLRLLSFYTPTEECDDQMKELFSMGENESHIWQVHI